MNLIFHHLKETRREAILGPLFKLIEALLDLLVPLVVGLLVDRGIGEGDRAATLRFSLLLAGLGLVGLLFSVTAQYFCAKAATGTAAGIRRALYGHIVTLSYADLDKLGGSTLVTRMTSDVSDVQSGVNLALRLLLRSPLIVFGAMGMALSLGGSTALPFPALIPALSLVVYGVMLLSMPLYKKARGKLDRVMLLSRENLSGVREIRAHRLEARETESFERATGELADAERKTAGIAALQSPLTYVLVNLAVVWLLQRGAIRVNAGTLSQGTVISLYNYMAEILVELVKLANLIVSITKALGSAGRIRAVLETEASIVSGNATEGAAGAPAVEFSDVSLRYAEGGDDAIRGVSLSVKDGEVVGVIGSTGAGKSSLLSLIPRFYDATGGAVKVFGVDVRDYDLPSLRRMIGTVPQKPQLFSGTIRENLTFGTDGIPDGKLLEAVTAAQADDVLADKGGLDAPIEQGGRNLSGGQKQRLTVARALAREPKILLLDDASSALDFQTEAALRRALRELPGKPTVFLVSSRVSSVRHADRILVLDEGRVAGLGTHDELMASSDVYREIFLSQSRGEVAPRA